MWNSLFPDFENHQIICFDAFGHGKSAGNDSKAYSMEANARAIADVLSKEKIKNPIVIGHSMGGYIGLELLKRCKLNTLILLNSNFWADSELRVQNRNRLIDVVGLNKDFFLNEAIGNLFHIKSSTIDQTIKRLVEGAKKISVESIIKTTRGLRDRKDNTQLLNSYSNQIVVVQADLDPIIPLNEMELAIEDLKKRPEFHIIKNSGHMSIWENPKATRRIIKQIVLGSSCEGLD